MEIDILRKFNLNLLGVKGLGPVTFKKLLEELGIEGIYSRKDELFPNLATDDSLFKTLNLKGIKFVCLWEDSYPTNLKSIDDPPIILFYLGSYEKVKIDRSISIVGTRDISSYGKIYAQKFTKELSERKYSIVSGMAFGIDRESHLATIQSGGYTIAVLASSPDNPTPAFNSDVYRKILDSGGLILSETIPGTKLNAGLFPNRNRIVAAISLGTLVVEAAEKSGALITANLALDYGREVFAVPGNLGQKGSEGTNSLIRDNKAKLVKSIADIIVEFGNESLAKIEQYEDINLSFEEKEVYNAILGGPIWVEDISKIIKKDISVVLSICSILELKGVINKDISGKLFV